MNKTRMYIVFSLLTALMVTACTLEGDIEEVLEKAGIGNNNNPNKLAAPSGVTATAESSSRITVRWNPVSGADGYIVYRSSSVSGSFNFLGDADTTTYTDDKGLSANTTYYYKVSAYNSNGESSQSSPSPPATTRLDAPSGINGQGLSSSTFSISWSSVSGAEGYYVYRSLSPSGSYSKIGPPIYDATTYTVNDQPANTIYYYKVSAFNSNGESSLSSSSITVTTH